MQLVGRDGVEHRTGEGTNAAQPGRPVVVRRDDATHDVAVTAHELRRGVQDERGSVGDRLLEHRRREGVVDRDRHLRGLRDDGGDVDEVQRGVGRRLDKDEPGVRAERIRDRVRRRPGHAGPEQTGGEQVVRASVEGADGDDVRLLGGDGGEQDSTQGGHPAREGDRRASHGLRLVRVQHSPDKLRRLVDGILGGDLRLPVEAIPFTQIAEAHRRLDAKHSQGKVVLDLSDNPHLAPFGAAVGAAQS